MSTEARGEKARNKGGQSILFIKKKKKELKKINSSVNKRGVKEDGIPHTIDLQQKGSSRDTVED